MAMQEMMKIEQKLNWNMQMRTFFVCLNIDCYTLVKLRV